MPQPLTKKQLQEWSQRNVEAFNGLMDINGLLPVSGDIQSGLLAANDVSKGNYGSAALNGIGLLPFVPSMAGMFIGKGAKVWDVLKADEAAKLAKAGVDPKEIWGKTGTFQGVDGAWRQEIPDNAAKLRGYPKSSGETLYSDNAFENLDHPLLQKAWGGDKYFSTPGMRINNSSESPHGAYLSQLDSILINSPNKDDAKSTALHELQHAIQEREGWARGGSPEMFKSSPVEGLHSYDDMLHAEQIINMAKQYGKSVNEFMKNPPRWVTEKQVELAKIFENKSAKDLQYAKNYILEKTDPHTAYLNLAGEAEARATQARMNMTMPERLNTFPFDSYDVPKEQLIVRGLLGSQK